MTPLQPTSSPLSEPPRLGDVSRGRDNNFDFLRFFFAVWVIYTHAYYLDRGGNRGNDFLYVLSRGQTNFGNMAVNGFFAISGFLITASWLRSPGLWDYAVKRVLRIFPGLIVSILLCIFVIGPLSAPPAGAYFHSLGPKTIILAMLHMRPPDLPGVFAHVPVPGIVNGVLWTVTAEVKMYVMVALLGLGGAYRRPSNILLLFLFSMALVAWKLVDPHSPFAADHTAIRFVGVAVEWPRLLSFYTAGMAAYMYRDRIPYSAALCAGCAAAFGVSLLGGMPLVIPVAFTYLIFYAAFSKRIPLHHWGRNGDFSYGLYLYSWPVQQTLVERFAPSLGPVSLFFASLAATFALAFLSWNLVEKPFLRLKPRTAARPSQPLAPAQA